eukprot:1071184-Ditylum_brightwellii.AAC.1
MNDDDMVVLKLKKYLNDPDTPCVVIDAALTALERNTNCEALYIQECGMIKYYIYLAFSNVLNAAYGASILARLTMSSQKRGVNLRKG